LHEGKRMTERQANRERAGLIPGAVERRGEAETGGIKKTNDENHP